MTGEPEVLLDAEAMLGEGPCWDAKTGELIWVDIPRQMVHWYDPAARRDRSFDVGRAVAAVAPAESGGLVLGTADGFWLLRDGALTKVADVEADQPDTRMNDAKCDAAGRFWAGTIALDLHAGGGSLYRMDADRTVTRVLGGLHIPNGMGWSPDNRTMYFIDSFAYCVFAYDFDAGPGTLSNPRRFIEIPEAEGLADGMTVDAEGYVWVALFGGWALRRYAPDGTLDREIRLPVSQVTSCAFGGEDYTDLYITSATNTATGTLSPEQRAAQPHAGALFRIRPGVKGIAPRACRI